jgi:hypothetical protein
MRARILPSAVTAVVVATVLLRAGPAASQASSGSSYPYLRTRIPGKDQCLAWNTRELVYTVDAAGSLRTPADTELAAIDAAWATWQAASTECSDFQFIRGPQIQDAPVGYLKDGPNTNVIVFRELACRDVVPPADACFDDGTCANKFRCWDYPDFTIGLTTTTFSFRTGNILDADIELNASPHFEGDYFLFTAVASPPCPPGQPAPNCVATDIQNTLTHEIGHVLGFDHVAPEDPRAYSTMEASAEQGETRKRALDPGTRRGFCDSYPRNLPATSCDDLGLVTRRVVARNRGVPGVGCAAAGSGGPGGSGPGPVLALALAALLGRRMLRARHARSQAGGGGAGRASPGCRSEPAVQR